MIIQTGLALLLIWLMNWIWMIREVLRHTPNWRDKDVESDEIVQNFMNNTPLERMLFIQKIGEMNPIIGVSAIAIILTAFII